MVRKWLGLSSLKRSSIVFHYQAVTNHEEELIPRATGKKYGQVLMIHNDNGFDQALVKKLYRIQYNNVQLNHFFNMTLVTINLTP